MATKKINTRGCTTGFTLIEILIVIGIMVILMSAVLVAINPFRQFAIARNATRWSGVTAIMNAVHQNMVDNAGTFVCAAGDIPAVATNMSSTAGDYNICSCIVGDPTAVPPLPSYIVTMPHDPDPAIGSYTDCTSYDTGYTICMGCTVPGRITVAAPHAELGETIAITR